MTTARAAQVSPWMVAFDRALAILRERRTQLSEDGSARVHGHGCQRGLPGVSSFSPNPGGPRTQVLAGDPAGGR
jgi:hypothetical protein